MKDFTLHDFLSAKREKIIARTSEKVGNRGAPRATAKELENGIPLFFDSADRVRNAAAPGRKG